MAIVKDEALILQVYEQGNTSQVLVLLSRRLGQIRVLAKGARRFHKQGFEGGFDLLARGEILAYARRDEHLWIFKEWEERARCARLGHSPRRLAAASYLSELTAALTRETAGAEPEENEPGTERAALFEHLAASAEALDRLPEHACEGPVLLQFTVHALADAGLLPPLDRCSRCGKPLMTPSESGAPRSRELALLSHAGLECESCLASEALDNLPVGMAPPGTKRELARLAAPPGRAVWLSPESIRALDYILRTGKAVRLSSAAAEALARAAIVLVQGALERDLRTLRAAARMIYALGPGKPNAVKRRPAK